MTVEFRAVLPVVKPLGATWLVPAVGPHGLPRASIRPVFSVPAVDGLVCIVPAADGLVPMVPDADGFGLVGDVVAPEPLMLPEPLMPAEPLLVPDDAPAEPAAPPLAPPPAPPPWASASPVLPARRIAAIIDSECRVCRIANSSILFRSSAYRGQRTLALRCSSGTMMGNDDAAGEMPPVNVPRRAIKREGRNKRTPSRGAISPNVQTDRNLRRRRRLSGEERDLSCRRTARPEGSCRQQRADHGAARAVDRARGGWPGDGRGRRLDRRARGAGRRRRHRRRAAGQPRA